MRRTHERALRKFSERLTPFSPFSSLKKKMFVFMCV